MKERTEREQRKHLENSGPLQQEVELLQEGTGLFLGANWMPGPTGAQVEGA